MLGSEPTPGPNPSMEATEGTEGTTKGTVTPTEEMSVPTMGNVEKEEPEGSILVWLIVVIAAVGIVFGILCVSYMIPNKKGRK